RDVAARDRERDAVRKRRARARSARVRDRDAALADERLEERGDEVVAQLRRELGRLVRRRLVGPQRREGEPATPARGGGLGEEREVARLEAREGPLERGQ